MQPQNQTPQSAPAPKPTPPPQQPSPVPDEVKVLNQADKLKRFFFQVLIACLIGAAGIAVMAVLAGSFNDVLGRALGTIAIVAVHALFSFSYVTETEKRDKRDGGRSIELFSDTVFSLIAISFITSTLAIWGVIGGDITLKLYLFYGVILFATLHADVLYRIRGFEKRIDSVVTANYLFMTAVVVMLSIVIFASDPSYIDEFFYRLLAALGIIDATMTITAIIMHKMYLQKHPAQAAKAAEANNAKSKNFWKNPLVVLLIIFLAFQVIGSLLSLVMRGFWSN